MAKTISLTVVTPERCVIDEAVTFFSLRGGAGELGILPEHIPLCSTVVPGVLHYRCADGRAGVLSVLGGFLNVQPDKAIVLAEASERAEDIDAARARAAQVRAETRLSEQRDLEAELALERALVRLRAFDALAAVRR